MALNAAVTAPIVMQLCGWKTEKMMRRYAAVTDTKLRAAAEAVSGIAGLHASRCSERSTPAGCALPRRRMPSLPQPLLGRFRRARRMPEIFEDRYHMSCRPIHGSVGKHPAESARPVDTPNTPNYYEVLQVSRAAQPLIITKAYRLLAAFYHPDNKETGDRETFQKVVSAYRVLCDPVRRAAYDRDTFEPSSPPPSNGGPREPELSERRTEDERDLRRQLLQALYNLRRTEPHRPSLPLMVIPDLFGCSIDEAQFTLWYLRGKKFMEMTDDGMVITVAGVDYVESQGLDPGAGTPPDPALGPRSFMLERGDQS